MSAKTPAPVWKMAEVLPCMSSGAATIAAAEDLADALVAQAHAEDGHLAGQLGHHGHAHAAVLGPARPR